MSARDLTRYFLRLGTFGFGGPIALVGYMQRDLVETRGWFTAEEFGEGLAFAQLAPGPLAAQLAIYLGWLRGGAAGATLTGLAFIGPSFLMVLVLSWLYVRFGGMPWMRGAFYGIGAAVIAIIARSAVRLLKLTVRRDPLLWGLFAINAIVTAVTASESLALFVASGVVALAVRGGWRWSSRPTAAVVAPLLLTLPAAPALLQILWFFTKAGAVVFGSGLAIVPFLYGGVVHDFGWLTERQFLDAVAVSMITPGPVVITVAFIGYLAAGLPGAFAASVGVFLPVYLITVFAAPYYRRLAASLRVRAFVQGVTAAATGTIAGAAVVLGSRAIVDGPTIGVAAATLGLLVVTKRIPEPAVILAAGAAGVLLS